VRRDAVRAAGAFDSAVDACADWDFWLRIASKCYRFARVPEAITYYRTWPGSMSMNPRVMYEAAVTVLRRARRYHVTCDICQRNIDLGIRFMQHRYIRQSLHFPLKATRSLRGKAHVLRQFARILRHDRALAAASAAWGCRRVMQFLTWPLSWGPDPADLIK
jgi:hypothetical protein